MSPKKVKSPKKMWWARADVFWQQEDLRDQMVVLSEPEAKKALAWWRALGATTWTEVAAIAPELEEHLREHAEELEWEDDEFRFEDIPAFADGDLPPAPQATMEWSLPKELVATHGTVERTVFSGDLVYFVGPAQDAALEWLTAHGYECEEHPELGVVLQDPSDQLPSQ